MPLPYSVSAVPRDPPGWGVMAPLAGTMDEQLAANRREGGMAADEWLALLGFDVPREVAPRVAEVIDQIAEDHGDMLEHAATLRKALGDMAPEVLRAGVELSKGRKAEVGAERTWNGKRMRKVTGGKWVQVSQPKEGKAETEGQAKRRANRNDARASTAAKDSAKAPAPKAPDQAPAKDAAAGGEKKTVSPDVAARYNEIRAHAHKNGVRIKGQLPAHYTHAHLDHLEQRVHEAVGKAGEAKAAPKDAPKDGDAKDGDAKDGDAKAAPDDKGATQGNGVKRDEAGRPVGHDKPKGPHEVARLQSQVDELTTRLKAVEHMARDAHAKAFMARMHTDAAAVRREPSPQALAWLTDRINSFLHLLGAAGAGAAVGGAVGGPVGAAIGAAGGAMASQKGQVFVEPVSGRVLLKAGGGWEPIPGGKHGGYRKRSGTHGYVYWYPDPQAAGNAQAHHAAAARALDGGPRTASGYPKDPAKKKEMADHLHAADALKRMGWERSGVRIGGKPPVEAAGAGGTATSGAGVTSTNVSSVVRHVNENGGRIPDRVPPASLPHLKRALAAGILERDPSGTGYRLTQEGADRIEREGLVVVTEAVKHLIPSAAAGGAHDTISGPAKSALVAYPVGAKAGDRVAVDGRAPSPGQRELERTGMVEFVQTGEANPMNRKMEARLTAKGARVRKDQAESDAWTRGDLDRNVAAIRKLSNASYKLLDTMGDSSVELDRDDVPAVLPLVSAGLVTEKHDSRERNGVVLAFTTTTRTPEAKAALDAMKTGEAFLHRGGGGISHRVYEGAADNSKGRDVATIFHAGLYAVHNQNGKYVVTHTPTGYAVSQFDSPSDATAFASHMHREAGTAGHLTSFGWKPDAREMATMGAAVQTFKPAKPAKPPKAPKAPAPKAPEPPKAPTVPEGYKLHSEADLDAVPAGTVMRTPNGKHFYRKRGDGKWDLYLRHPEPGQRGVDEGISSRAVSLREVPDRRNAQVGAVLKVSERVPGDTAAAQKTYARIEQAGAEGVHMSEVDIRHVGRLTRQGHLTKHPTKADHVVATKHLQAPPPKAPEPPKAPAVPKGTGKRAKHDTNDHGHRDGLVPGQKLKIRDRHILQHGGDATEAEVLPGGKFRWNGAVHENAHALLNAIHGRSNHQTTVRRYFKLGGERAAKALADLRSLMKARNVIVSLDQHSDRLTLRGDLHKAQVPSYLWDSTLGDTATLDGDAADALITHLGG